MPRAFAFRLKPSHKDRVEEHLRDNQIAIGWSRARGLLDPTLVMAPVPVPPLPPEREDG
jgi:hypothetical protein